VSKYARRVDANHAQVVATLRAAGAWVWDTSRLGGGFPDLLVYHPRAGGAFLVEVKDGRRPPSERRLTPAEERFARAYPGRLVVVCSPDDALAAIGVGVAA
jgi:hypothetical protein